MEKALHLEEKFLLASGSGNTLYTPRKLTPVGSGKDPPPKTGTGKSKGTTGKCYGHTA